MRDWNADVYEIVQRIPRGAVATYGQIAALVSSPRAARGVGMALRHLPEGSSVPWHRVISSTGAISIENFDHPAEEQANLLMAEGIVVHRSEKGYSVDLARYLWQPASIDKGVSL